MRQLKFVSQGSYLALIGLTVLWETWLAPNRTAMYFWLAVKLVPLLLPLAAILRDRPQGFLYGCLVALLYLTEAAVITYTQAARPLAVNEPRLLAWIELGLVTVFFFSAAFYVRERRRAEVNRAQARAETGS